MKKKISIVVGIMVIAVGGVYYWRYNPKSTEQETAQSQPEPYVNPFIGFTVSKKVYPVIYTLIQASDPLVVINKKHSLPAEYIPELSQGLGVSLRPQAYEAYKNLISGARSKGINLTPISSYRSYEQQSNLFNDYARKDGQVKAETYSARPGHSEHQSGFAVDIGLPSGSCNLDVCMGKTKEGAWLADHAHEYGFIIRYPEGKELETGYQYEPWHIRYVGVDVATGVYESGYTLDTYFGITAGDYVSQPTTN